MQRNHNSGATVWLWMPRELLAQNAAIKVAARMPPHAVVYVTMPGPNATTLLRGLAAAESAFKAEHVELWHARQMGDNVMIGNAKWDRHPAYTGPADYEVAVFCPLISEQRTRDEAAAALAAAVAAVEPAPEPTPPAPPEPPPAPVIEAVVVEPPKPKAKKAAPVKDRKSTRLNSSHT